MKTISLFFILLTIVFNPGFCQQKLRVAFYNTENFFDTINDPNKEDEEYIPSSELKWGTERYFNKITKIGQVLDSVGKGNLPSIIGMCEVESELAVSDLLKYSSLKREKYKFCISNSPDVRGINVALVYNESIFKLTKKEEINVSSNEFGDYKTRNILYVVLETKEKEKFHVFINHWPSRRGGEKESEGKRIYAAKQLRFKTDSILKSDKKSQIIIMGDFNDHPNDKSIKEVLVGSEKESKLINLFEKEHSEGRGSHYYEGEWGVLDQIIVSTPLIEKSGWYFPKTNYGVYKGNFLLFKNNKTGEIRPSRTYGGNKYYNGYSDHLPVFIELEKSK